MDEVDGVRLFWKNDAGYLAWLTAHPNGYVLNAERRPRAAYLVLHTPGCGMINDPQRHEPDAFTSRDYIKACADRVEPLKVWMAQFGAHDFSKRCGSCHPRVDELDLAEVAQLTLAQEVRHLQADPQALAQALKAPPEPPGFVLTQTKVYRRSAAVVAYVLQRAQGKCEGCGAAAPFVKASDGQPYLEVHHKQPLAAGGLDCIDNAIALCPNCHRKGHFG